MNLIEWDKILTHAYRIENASRKKFLFLFLFKSHNHFFRRPSNKNYVCCLKFSLSHLFTKYQIFLYGITVSVKRDSLQFCKCTFEIMLSHSHSQIFTPASFCLFIFFPIFLFVFYLYFYLSISLIFVYCSVCLSVRVYFINGNFPICNVS